MGEQGLTGWAASNCAPCGFPAADFPSNEPLMVQPTQASQSMNLLQDGLGFSAQNSIEAMGEVDSYLVAVCLTDALADCGRDR